MGWTPGVKLQVGQRVRRDHPDLGPPVEGVVTDLAGIQVEVDDGRRMRYWHVAGFYPVDEGETHDDGVAVPSAKEEARRAAIDDAMRQMQAPAEPVVARAASLHAIDDAVKESEPHLDVVDDDDDGVRIPTWLQQAEDLIVAGDGPGLPGPDAAVETVSPPAGRNRSLLNSLASLRAASDRATTELRVALRYDESTPHHAYDVLDTLTELERYINATIRGM